jgi:hypothetical protein
MEEGGKTLNVELRTLKDGRVLPGRCSYERKRVDGRHSLRFVHSLTLVATWERHRPRSQSGAAGLMNEFGELNGAGVPDCG